MTVDIPTMRQIVSNVFDEMLGMPTLDTDTPHETLEKSRMVASIRISGETEQLVVVEAPMSTAQLIAETMFAADSGSLETTEIRDAVGEIVNMIGGNVKGIYDGESTLSLPCCHDEPGGKKLEFDSTDGNERIVLTVSGFPLLVHWHAMTPAVA